MDEVDRYLTALCKEYGVEKPGDVPVEAFFHGLEVPPELKGKRVQDCTKEEIASIMDLQLRIGEAFAESAKHTRQ